MINDIIDKEVQEIFKILNDFNFKKTQIKNFKKICTICLKSLKNNNKIIFYGNGGSASDSQHLATEFVVKYKKKRKAMAAISLATDNSAITAAGNDFGFEYIFSRQIEAIGKKGDVAIALTTSGNSKNLIQAAKVAKKMKIKTVCFSGNNGGKLKNFSDLSFIIPSKSTSAIQVIELMFGQLLCEFIEKN